MATHPIQLTPHTDQTPAVVELAKELSGAQWCARFPGDNTLQALEPGFRPKVTAFFAALDAAGVSKSVGAVFRPKSRAFLMHWSYMLYTGRVKAKDIPNANGVPIEWVHPTEAESVRAAEDMCKGYQTHNLGTIPALHSQHEVRLAIDVTISWSGILDIANQYGTTTEIKSSPRSGMNAELVQVGATYGVIKYNRTGTDKPHWSSTGA